MKATIFLPWPNSKLSPNARLHWAAKAKATKAAKRDAYYAALEAGIGKITSDTLAVRYVFFPPDRRPRDLDNLAAQTKASSDGIRDAVGIDDSKWTVSFSKAGAIEKNGMVKVELEWPDNGGGNEHHG